MVCEYGTPTVAAKLPLAVKLTTGSFTVTVTVAGDEVPLPLLAV